MVPLEIWRIYHGKLSLNECFFFVSRFQKTKGRMIAPRRPPAKPPNPPRNPTSGQRPSLSKSVCWMDQTMRLQLRCANTDAPPSLEGRSMATRWKLCQSQCRADHTRQELCRSSVGWALEGVRWYLANCSDPKVGMEQSKGFGCVSEI